jgi:tRNA threonylcarbamoyladenosine biosynthesis protein TsaE
MAKEILKSSKLPTASIKKNEQAKVIALVGELGAGKTTFSQGFLKALGVKRRVISPTFLIIRKYAVRSKKHEYAFHMDCYRLNNSIELLSLGFKDILANPQNIVLIEWPELVKKYLPKNTVWIKIEHGDKPTIRYIIKK